MKLVSDLAYGAEYARFVFGKIQKQMQNTFLQKVQFCWQEFHFIYTAIFVILMIQKGKTEQL